MDKPINGDKYVRTLSHYLRHNQKRLVPIDPDAPHHDCITTSNSNSGSNSPISQSVRSILTPADPMAAAYSGMVNSLWSVGTAMVNTVTPSSQRPTQPPPPTVAQDRDSFNGAWDGTGIVASDSNPRERQLYLNAQLRAPILPLDLYYLLYLLERFEMEGIEIEGWDGSTPRSVGDSKPRVLNNTYGNGNNNTTITYSSFPPPQSSSTSTRPQSIRSFSSTALSTLTLITGWKQWSSAASSNNQNMTLADDIHFIHKFLKKISALRLVAKILPTGLDLDRQHQRPAKGARIEGFSADAIVTFLNASTNSNSGSYLNSNAYSTRPSSSSENLSTSSSPPSSSKRRQQQSKQQQQFNQHHHLLLPLAAVFSSLTHLELHKIPPRSVEGWEALMPRLKSLVIVQAGLEDVHEAIVMAVVESERRRRQRISREKNRAVLIRQEQREALKDASATTVSKGRRLGGGHQSSSSSGSSAENSLPSSPSAFSSAAHENLSEDEQAILGSIQMWPVLRHLSVSDNAIAQMKSSETFSYSQEIVTLDLSHNLLNAAPHSLIHLHNLHNLNLSYNMVTSVQAIYQVLGNIAVLDLRGNRLESLCGLERLWNLEKIDVRENLVDEAAEVGRLAALPSIREVWAEMNPFCTSQPKYRLEILAVFKANGHDLLLDGTFATFTEKRLLANISPSSFSTTIGSINVVNVANIPAASAPTAMLVKELAPSPPRITRPTLSATKVSSPGGERSGTKNNENSLLSPSKIGTGSGTGSGDVAGARTGKPSAKKKLVKSTRRVRRVVNLDSDHDEDDEDDEEHREQHHHHHHHHHENEEGQGGDDDHRNGESDDAYAKVLGSPAVIGKKKKMTKKTAGATGAVDDDGSVVAKKAKKKTSKKKSPVSSGERGVEGDEEGVDHSQCRDGHHVHRLAQLERAMSSLQQPHQPHQRGILKRPSAKHPHSPQYPNDQGLRPNQLDGIGGGLLRPSSPNGSAYSSDDGAEGYRRRIEAMRNEAGPNWLKVLAEMDGESSSSLVSVSRTEGEGH